MPVLHTHTALRTRSWACPPTSGETEKAAENRGRHPPGGTAFNGGDVECLEQWDCEGTYLTWLPSFSSKGREARGRGLKVCGDVGHFSHCAFHGKEERRRGSLAFSWAIANWSAGVLRRRWGCSVTGRMLGLGGA